MEQEHPTLLMNNEVAALQNQNRIMEMHNEREYNKLRKKIKTMKVKNWMVSINSPLHKDYGFHDPLRQ